MRDPDSTIESIKSFVTNVNEALQQPEVKYNPPKLREFYNQASEYRRQLFELFSSPDVTEKQQIVRFNHNFLMPLIGQLQTLGTTADEMAYRILVVKLNLFNLDCKKKSFAFKVRKDELHEDALDLENEFINSGLLKSQNSGIAQKAVDFKASLTKLKENIMSSQGYYVGLIEQAPMQPQSDEEQAAAKKMQYAEFEVKFTSILRADSYFDRGFYENPKEQNVRLKELCDDAEKLKNELIKSDLLQSQDPEIAESAEECIATLEGLQKKWQEKIKLLSPDVSLTGGAGMWTAGGASASASPSTAVAQGQERPKQG